LHFSGKQHENPRPDEMKVMTHVGKSTERRAIIQTGMMNSAKSVMNSKQQGLVSMTV
jgi:hypothetical protein